MNAFGFSKQKGFTIVELLIVIVVIAILAAVTAVAFNGIQHRAHIAAVMSDLHNAGKRLALDRVAVGTYPATIEAADGGKGLKASAGTTLQYTVDNSAKPPTFCLSAVNGSLGYSTTQAKSPAEGVCPGHTGPITDSGSGGSSAVYAIGDHGPAGGRVFYDKGGKSNSWRYLEAAPRDLRSRAQWDCIGARIRGADGTDIGIGQRNTVEIEAGCRKVGGAADMVVNYKFGGYNDWFLPSKDELNQLYVQQAVVGGFTSSGYWSSSQYSADSAWFQFFGPRAGDQKIDSKNSGYSVRPIRAFNDGVQR